MISIRMRVRRRIRIGVRAVGFEMSLQALSMQQTRFDPIEGVPSFHRLDGLAKRFEGAGGSACGCMSPTPEMTPEMGPEVSHEAGCAMWAVRRWWT